MLRAKRAERTMTLCMPIFFRSSCSGSAAQDRKVTTSFAICVVVAGVPSAYSTRPSYSTRAMPIAPPGKYGLPSLVSWCRLNGRRERGRTCS